MLVVTQLKCKIRSNGSEQEKKCLRSLFPDLKCNSHVQLTATPNNLEVCGFFLFWFFFNRTFHCHPLLQQNNVAARKGQGDGS